MKKLVLVQDRDIILVKTPAGLSLPDECDIEFSEDAEKFCYGNYIASRISSVTNFRVAIERKNLRESWQDMKEEEYQAASKGMELLNWNDEERYCGRDGVKLVRHTEISKICPACGAEYFPRLNPAIVVLVTKGDEALLVHARTLKKQVMALVAGFVETGESLEECVKREVMEETSLEIEDIRYYGSQSWPFPHQLMVGFTARYKSGEIGFADGELCAGGFFTRENPPLIPSMPSLSRMIIDSWLNNEF